MSKILSLPIQFFNVQDVKTDDRLMKIKLYAICEGLNRNKTIFTPESLQSAISTVFNTPILAHFDKLIKDVTDHRCNLKIDSETGEPYYDFTNGERIIGIINESSEINIEDLNGKKWLTYTGYIFTQYNYEIKKMLKKYKKKKVSVEILVKDAVADEKGIETINSFVLLGTTILGEKVTEGIAGAHLDLLSYSKQNLNDLKLQLAYALQENDNQTQLPNQEDEDINQIDTDDDDKSEVKKYSKVGEKVDETKMMEAFASMTGYEFVGYTDKYAYGMKDGKYFAIAYEVVEDTVKMSEDKVYECSVYAKYEVSEEKEGEKVEGVEGEETTEEGKKKEVVDEYAVSDKYSAYVSKFTSEKEEMSAKYAEVNSKYEEMTSKYEEVNSKYEEMNCKYEETSKKYEEIEKEKEEMSAKYAEVEKELNEYKNKEFNSSIATVLAQYSLKEEEVTAWTEKSKTYSDVETFAKDLVYEIVKTNGAIKKNDESFVKYSAKQSSVTPPKKKSNDPMEHLRLQFENNNK